MTLPLSKLPPPDPRPVPGRPHGTRSLPVSDVIREFGLATMAKLPDDSLRGLLRPSMTSDGFCKLMRVVNKRRSSMTMLIGAARLRGVDRGEGVRITEGPAR